MADATTVAATERLRQERRALIRFGVVGVLGYGANIALFALFAGPLGWDHRVAAAVATILALCENFLLNRFWTFEAHAGDAAVQARRFAVVSAAAVAFNVIGIWVLVDLLGMPKVGGQALAILLQAPVSYLGNRIWTFA